jgi:hypothetical protein
VEPQLRFCALADHYGIRRNPEADGPGQVDEKRIITGQCRGREGQRRVLESSILFSFETDFTGRVKAGPQIETWQGRSAAALTPAVILFIALPEAEDNIEPG